MRFVSPHPESPSPGSLDSRSSGVRSRRGRGCSPPAILGSQLPWRVMEPTLKLEWWRRPLAAAEAAAQEPRPVGPPYTSPPYTAALWNLEILGGCEGWGGAGKGRKAEMVAMMVVELTTGAAHGRGRLPPTLAPAS